MGQTQMIKWTKEQRDEIWRLYVEKQLTVSQIAERYAHLGASRNSISGVIGRYLKKRDEQVETELKLAATRADKKPNKVVRLKHKAASHRNLKI